MTATTSTTRPSKPAGLDRVARSDIRREVLVALTGDPRPPRRPLARLIAAAAAAAAALIGAWLPDRLATQLAPGWDRATIILTDTGARYVALDGVLYPVANAVSALLLVPPSAGRFVHVSDRQLDTAPRGTQIGIVGAPDSIPSADALSATGWTACLNGQERPQVRVAGGAADRSSMPTPSASSTPDAQVQAARAAPTALLVRSAAGLSLVTGGFRLDLPAADAPAVLQAIGWEQVAPVDVPATWLALFSQADDLVPLHLPRSTGPAGPHLPAAARVGSLLVTGPIRTASSYLVTGADRLSRLTALTATLYALGSPADTIPVTESDIASVPTVTDPASPAGWPATLPVPDRTARCAVLGTDADGVAATVTIRSPPTTGGPAGTVPVGAGALVRAASPGPAASGESSGQVFLVDATGTAYPLAADSLAMARLGYQQSDVREVPVGWLSLLPRGPTLAVAAAATPVP